MSRPNYRIKLDLSKYYQDARRSSWVFIDQSLFYTIRGVKNHIRTIFGIQEPFYLLLNGTDYLPLCEDVRILRENEVLTVVPGTGSFEEPATFAEPKAIPKVQNGTTEEQSQTLKVVGKPQTVDTCTQVDVDDLMRINLGCTPNFPSNASVAGTSVAGASMYYSVLNNTEAEADSASDSRATDSIMTEDNSVADKALETNGKKRKRIRRKKSKKQLETPSTNRELEDSESKKPKIIDSLILSSRKHIRFDNGENKNTDSKDCENSEKTLSCNNGDPRLAQTSPNNLSTLLALRQCSTPLTFVSKKIKQEIKVENVSDEAARNDGLTDETKKALANTLMSNTPISEVEAHTLALLIDPEKFPIAKSRPKRNDIIAFKVLKIGEDYTPQVSNFIVAKVMETTAELTSYTLKIFRGKSEVKAPLGKFALPEEEPDNTETDTVTLNYMDFITPRVIHW